MSIMDKFHSSQTQKEAKNYGFFPYFHHHFAQGIRSNELNTVICKAESPTTSGKWIPETKIAVKRGWKR